MMCAEPAMDKALKAYQTVIDEAVTWDCRKVWDKHGKFTGWVWEIQHELKPKGDTED